MTEMATCPACKGDGEGQTESKNYGDIPLCRACRGQGKVETAQSLMTRLAEIITCPDAAEISYDATRQQWIVRIYAQGREADCDEYGKGYHLYRKRYVGGNLGVLIEDIKADVAHEQTIRKPELKVVK